MKGTLTFNIDKKITESVTVEHCLMYCFSGYRGQAFLFLSLYAMAKKWKYDKLLYYLELMK